MTALKPIENRRVRGVASERYPINAKCAHPECSEPTTVHHVFPRSQIKSDSYFVEIVTTDPADDGEPGAPYEATVIPHAVGLCGSGTTGHHGDVEEHRAWIKLEDGVFQWYDRVSDYAGGDGVVEGEKLWVGGPDPIVERATKFQLLGPLNPQPGSREGKPKRKKYQGEARRKRATISVKVPQDDQENGAGIWDDLIEQLRERYDAEGLPIYNVAVRAFYEALTS